MLTFSAAAGGVSVSGGARRVSVFSKGKEDDVHLLAAPEEQPSGNTISWPGEYDVAGITLRGVGHEEGQQVSWLAVIDGVRCAFPSSPLRDWTDAEIEALGDVDILLLPAEEPKAAQKLIDEVDPRVLILIDGKNGKIHDDVVKHCGAQGKVTVAEYKQKGSFPAEGREVVVLSA
jgi:hypothetical protein